MPIFLFAIAVILIVTALKGNQRELMDQVKKDFSGDGGFVLWIVAILLIGAIGYLPKMETISRATAGLIVLVFLVSNKGLLTKLNQAIRTIRWPTASQIEGQANVVNPADIGGGGGGTGGGATGGGGEAGMMGGGLGMLQKLIPKT